MKYKVYVCNNEECLQEFRRSEAIYGCKNREYCCAQCCFEDLVARGEDMFDFCGCEDCPAYEKGSWVIADHISIMCGEPAWFDYNWFKAHTLFHAMIQMPIGYIHTQEDLDKAKIIQSIIKQSGIFIRQISVLSDEEIYVEIGKIKS